MVPNKNSNIDSGIIMQKQKVFSIAQIFFHPLVWQIVSPAGYQNPQLYLQRDKFVI